MLDKFQCSESNKLHNQLSSFYITSVITTESQDHQTGPSKVLWFDVHVCQLS